MWLDRRAHVGNAVEPFESWEKKLFFLGSSPLVALSMASVAVSGWSGLTIVSAASVRYSYGTPDY